MEYYNYAAVVVGSGLSGLYSALKLSENLPEESRILLVTKCELGESNSMYAQGGIVAVLDENEGDSTASHISDTLNAGAGLSEFNTVKYISENSQQVIKDLINNYGIEFDCDESGNLLFTLEGAHSIKRILHCSGDATGRGMTKRLVELVQKNPKIQVMENSIAVDLLVEDETCNGVVVFDGKKYMAALTHAVVLASGGLGRIFKNTTNPMCATGDGYALACRAGAILQDMEFVQFHPTALAVDSEDKNFLISEAVRGEGAKLCDANGNYFMSEYHELEDLAPRDIVTRANYSQMQKAKTDFVYLDATKLGAEVLSKRFPNISSVCRRNNIDISKDYIPVHPAAHYFMGGIKANIDGRTSIRGLFALGEVASTGLHGANRLASNSLLECVVMAWSMAEFLKERLDLSPIELSEELAKTLKKYAQELGFIEYDTDLLKLELQEIMWDGAGVIRNEQSLKEANTRLQKLKSKFQRCTKCLSIQEYEFKNMLTVSQLIINAALNRKESRGAHFREDFPNPKDIAEHNCIVDEQGDLNFVR